MQEETSRASLSMMMPRDQTVSSWYTGPLPDLVYRRRDTAHARHMAADVKGNGRLGPVMGQGPGLGWPAGARLAGAGLAGWVRGQPGLGWRAGQRPAGAGLAGWGQRPAGNVKGCEGTLLPTSSWMTA